MSRKEIYYVIVNGVFTSFSMEELALFRLVHSRRPKIWSARLSTGLFGLTNCVSGNMGPKGSSEILLAVNDVGLRALIDFGFITCPDCKPETAQGFWPVIAKSVWLHHGVSSLSDFTNKNIVPFDARKVDWEKIIPITQAWPGRLYVPKGLCSVSLSALKRRIEKLGHGFPRVGYFNPESPEFFTSYELD